jgi:hypothetical protein
VRAAQRQLPQVTVFVNDGVHDVTAYFPRIWTAIDAATLDYDGDSREGLFVLRGSQRPFDASQYSSQLHLSADDQDEEHQVGRVPHVGHPFDHRAHQRGHQLAG